MLRLTELDPARNGIEPDSDRDESLPAEQREALQAAVEYGYYETPREIELGARRSARGPRSTLSYRLRRAESTLARTFVDADDAIEQLVAGLRSESDRDDAQVGARQITRITIRRPVTGDERVAPTRDSSRTLELRVPEMDCPSCAGKVRNSVDRLDGIDRIEPRVTSGRLIVDYEPAVTTEGAIRERVRAAGTRSRATRRN